MEFQNDISLKPYNTFGIDVKAKLFVAPETQSELDETLSSPGLMSERLLIVGEGSNLVFVNDFNGLIIKVSTKGIEMLKETNDEIFIKVQAGENWDHFVQYCVENNWGGLENMSMIPGCVGASPVQNVGAYGSEAKDVITKVETVDIRTKEKRFFSNEECKFAYRNSIFKILYGKYVVTAVEFCLNKKPTINLQYEALNRELQKEGIFQPDIQNVRDAVCRIRREKLPSPDEIGNAGSFFKNPVIDNLAFKKIQKEYPNIIHYQDKNGIKLAAAWMIEQCGWKGKSMGQAGVHSRQALVLVNLGNATGKEVLALSQAIQQSVRERFGVLLEPEANIINGL